MGLDLDAVADELYGLLPDEFTAARGKQAQHARRAGDRDLADAIKRLRKPTTAAWLANQLVRGQRDEVDALLRLGETLRATTADLAADELRRLTGERHRLVRSLVDHGRDVAREHDRPVSDTVLQELRRTLEATLADPGSAEQFAAGRLTEALDYPGFGVGVATAAAAPASSPYAAVSTSTTRAGAPGDGGARPRAQSDRRLRVAEEAVQRAAADRGAATQDLSGARRRREEAAADLARLRSELERATVGLRRAEAEEHALEQRLHRAERHLAAVERRRDQARAQRRDLPR